MKFTRTAAVIAMGAIAVLGLSACTAETGTETSGNTDGEQSYTVWYADVMDQNPVAMAITQGFNHTLEENGIKMTRSLAIDSTTGNIDLGAQAQGLTRAVAANPDAIAYFVLDPTAARPQIEEAQSKDIPVFAAFGKPEFDVTAYIELYDEDQGFASAQYLAENLPKGARVAMIGGPPTPNTLAEEAGAKKALEAAGVEIVGDIEQQRNLQDNSGGGKEVMQGILQQHPDVQGVWVYNDDSALGAIAAAKQAGTKVLFTSRNGTSDGVAAVKSGDLLATCDIEPLKFGSLFGQAIADHLKGTTVLADNARIESPPADNCLITKENADSWKAPEDQIKFVDITLG